MEEAFTRTAALIGEDAVKRLNKASIAVFGIGGVGGYAVEALARAGVGKLTIFDKDVITASNLNRQIIALTSTIGRSKVEVMRERIAQINPEIEVHACPCFFLPETADQVDFSAFDYVIDAVDTVTAKIELIVRAAEMKIPIISCMGAGNKLKPELFQIADIYETSVCPLAKVMRKELRARKIEKCKVVYSKEEPRKTALERTPGSISFVPAVAGLLLAGEVIRDICKIK